MKRSPTRARIAIGAAGALAAVLLGLAPAAGAARPGEKKMILTGTVQAVDTSFLGSVETVKIVSPEMGIYLIADDATGKQLTDHVGEVVTLVAVLKRNGDGQQFLYVQRFEVES
jgi:hypothetical protein